MKENVLLAGTAVLFMSVASSVILGQQPPAGRQGGAGAPAGRGQIQMPDGAGRDQVQARCGACHGLNLITGSFGYTKDGWQDRIATMLRLPAPEVDTICVVSGDALPHQGRPRGGADLRTGHGHDQGVVGAHTRIETARLARGCRRLDLVDRPVRAQARTARSAHRSGA